METTTWSGGKQSRLYGLASLRQTAEAGSGSRWYQRKKKRLGSNLPNRFRVERLKTQCRNHEGSKSLRFACSADVAGTGLNDATLDRNAGAGINDRRRRHVVSLRCGFGRCRSRCGRRDGWCGHDRSATAASIARCVATAVAAVAATQVAEQLVQQSAVLFATAGRIASAGASSTGRVGSTAARIGDGFAAANRFFAARCGSDFAAACRLAASAIAVLAEQASQQTAVLLASAASRLASASGLGSATARITTARVRNDFTAANGLCSTSAAGIGNGAGRLGGASAGTAGDLAAARRFSGTSARIAHHFATASWLGGTGVGGTTGVAAGTAIAAPHHFMEQVHRLCLATCGGAKHES